MRRLGTNLICMLARASAPLALGFLGISCAPRLPVEQILAGYQESRDYPELTFRCPHNNTLFPPEIAPCTFAWQDAAKADTWLVLVEFPGDDRRLRFVSQRRDWTPQAQEWQEIKKRSRGKWAKVTVLGLQRSAPFNLLSRGQITISTSKDEVGAPLVLSGSEPALCGRGEGPVAHSLALRDYYTRGTAAGSAGSTCPSAATAIPFRKMAGSWAWTWIMPTTKGLT